MRFRYFVNYTCKVRVRAISKRDRRLERLTATEKTAKGSTARLDAFLHLLPNVTSEVFAKRGWWEGLLLQEQNKDAINHVIGKNGDDDYRRRVSMRVRVVERKSDQK